MQPGGPCLVFVFESIPDNGRMTRVTVRGKSSKGSLSVEGIERRYRDQMGNHVTEVLADPGNIVLPLLKSVMAVAMKNPHGHQNFLEMLGMLEVEVEGDFYTMHTLIDALPTLFQDLVQVSYTLRR